MAGVKQNLANSIIYLSFCAMTPTSVFWWPANIKINSVLRSETHKLVTCLRAVRRHRQAEGG